jgi:hypothetical protein
MPTLPATMRLTWVVLRLALLAFSTVTRIEDVLIVNQEGKIVAVGDNPPSNKQNPRKAE